MGRVAPRHARSLDDWVAARCAWDGWAGEADVITGAGEVCGWALGLTDRWIQAEDSGAGKTGPKW